MEKMFENVIFNLQVTDASNFFIKNLFDILG